MAGTIRDDGPLPGVITDSVAAQRAMRAAIPGVGLALLVASTLHAVATGNLLPATVPTVCVDVNPGCTDETGGSRELPSRRTRHGRGVVFEGTRARVGVVPVSRLLVCPPDYFGIDYEINPWMQRSNGVSKPIAMRQWQSLMQELEAEIGAWTRTDATGAGFA